MQNMGVKAPIFLAVDTDDLKVAQEWIRATQDYVSGYKFGLEFFCAFGSEGIRQLKESTDSDIFLDLKLHDIPNTVVGATRQIISLRPRFLSVHALGGSAMIAAAVAEAPNIEIAAVTILTSLRSQDLTQMGYDLSPREAIGPEISIITPGVRPSLDASNDDQFRKMDPKSAIQAGATYLVIGRPITSAWAQGASALRDRAAAISSQLK
jgi:orotidine-5'-phosphate decarboxylase